MWPYNTAYPAIEDLIAGAKNKVPRFAFEYLDGGCNEDVNLRKNTSDIRAVELRPYYLQDKAAPSLQTNLFGHTYDAPFGVAPVGLQGLVWPKATEILAAAATQHNVPFVLSTVTTASIEKVAEITKGKAWFQLYHPREDALRDDLIDRLNSAAYPVLVLLCDVPSFGYRPRDIRNGLAMPPRMTLRNCLDIVKRPSWAIQTLLNGAPEFATMKPYIPQGVNMKQLGQFMNKTFAGQLNEQKISEIRDKWKGKLVLKGVASKEDMEVAVKLGLDGVIVSNHGGRQLDAAESAIQSLRLVVKEYSDKITVMMDSGIRSGVDVARVLTEGASFAFMGRTFMYGVGALGKKGGDHTMAILKTQLMQIMQQLNCSQTLDFKNHRI